MLRLLKFLFALCTLLVFLFCITLMHSDYFLRAILSSHKHLISERRGFLVSTPGCNIPDFDPFDLSISHIYSEVGDLSCSGSPPLVRSNRTHLLFNWDEIKKQHGSDVQCAYKAIWRKDEGRSDNKYGIDNHDTLISEDVKVNQHEFLKIECKSKEKTVFTDFFMFVKIKPDVEERCDDNFQKWVSQTKDITERLNIILVAIDSVSRLNMLRQLPKTYNYLTTQMNAIELQGFTKIADNTFVNVMPLLTGLFTEECWNETLNNKSMDHLNYIWKNFTQKGYRTLFGEDDAEIAAFNVRKAGFWQQPTDYYLRPFNLAVQKSGFLKKDFENCYNTRPETQVILQYLLDFLITFQDKPTFSFLFNSRLSHGEINAVGHADKIYEEFLKKYNDNTNLVNNSILIFFSDHGIRFGEIRDTFIGKLEERMPFFFLKFPPWFANKYPKKWKNLRINQNRLTTFFDIHQTLLELLNFTEHDHKFSRSHRGISLFSEVPPERTCEDAAILPHWCTCYSRQTVPVSNTQVKLAAKELINAINKKLLITNNKCAELEIDKIIDAHVSGINEKIRRFKESRQDVVNRKVVYGERLDGVSDYLITILVKPSGALFEGTVEYLESSGLYKVMGDISRINKYGNQSNCINSENLRKFCFCIEKN